MKGVTNTVGLSSTSSEDVTVSLALDVVMETRPNAALDQRRNEATTLRMEPGPKHNRKAPRPPAHLMKPLERIPKVP